MESVNEYLLNDSSQHVSCLSFDVLTVYLLLLSLKGNLNYKFREHIVVRFNQLCWNTMFLACLFPFYVTYYLSFQDYQRIQKKSTFFFSSFSFKFLKYLDFFFIFCNSFYHWVICIMDYWLNSIHYPDVLYA